MAVKVRDAPSRAAAGVNVLPAANTAGEQIAGSQILDWAMRGYIFSAGLLVDASDISVVTTLADTTPTIALQSPASKDLVVIPLRVHCSITAVTGGLTTFDLVYTKAAQECATVLALTGGTVMPGIQNHYVSNPITVRKSTCEFTVTATALTDVDTSILAHAEMHDNGLTAISMHMNRVFNYVFDVPIALTEGAALLLYGYSASTASTIRPTFTWAEIPRSVYIP
ncbi:hypothetical protein LCGC14_1455440 [marine sediment metagenome]|uniref:Uncharacterized protein n=1 Tax=marine sediment metagenome TaxID=412755 RepID=A0A0F9LX92_9ZZZZ